VNCLPGAKIVPSGIVSLTSHALAHSEAVVLAGSEVGEAAGARGVNVGENCRGVCVTLAVGAADVGCMFCCAATVSATAVCMPESRAGVGVLAAVQAVMIKDAITIKVKSVYFVVLYIFSFRAYYYTVKQKRPVLLPGALYSCLRIDYGQVKLARPNCW
jgi:hypothetical protein